MDTEKLFYLDPRQVAFDATLQSVNRVDQGWQIELDRTCFYPEGGGQPADRGTLNGIDVIHVSKHGDRILHLLSASPSENQVTGKIDWTHRYHFMQQHTGQHLISGALKKVGDYNTVSVHLGQSQTTVEIDTSDISNADMQRIEDEVNAAIAADLEVRPQWTDSSHLDRFPLRRKSKVEGDVRVVSIGDFDCVACGGIHVKRCGEVRLVKAVGVEKIRNHARTVWKIGHSAFDDYRLKHDVVSQLVAQLSAQAPDIPTSVAKMQDILSTLKTRCRFLELRLASALADALLNDASKVRHLTIVKHIYGNESPTLMRHLIEALSSKPGVVALVLNMLEERLMWYLCHGPNVALNMIAVKDRLMAQMQAKGGGKPPIWQGMARHPENPERILSAFGEVVHQECDSL